MEVLMKLMDKSPWGTEERRMIAKKNKTSRNLNLLPDFPVVISRKSLNRFIKIVPNSIRLNTTAKPRIRGPVIVRSRDRSVRIWEEKTRIRTIRKIYSRMRLRSTARDPSALFFHFINLSPDAATAM
jgi:hypothetical protein